MAPIHMSLPLAQQLVAYQLVWALAQNMSILFLALPKPTQHELGKDHLLPSYLMQMRINLQRLDMNLEQQLVAQGDVVGWI